MTGAAAALVALVLDLLGLGVTFGWRTLLHYRATGRTGYQGVTGRPGSLPWWGGVVFVLALLLTVAAPVAALADLVTPPAGWPHPVQTVAGLLVAVAGIGVALLAQHQMGTTWRIGVDPDERTPLVTGGVFAHVRNPFFTALAATTVGLVALVPTGISVLALACLITAVQIQVRVVEEPYLAACHASAYTAYAARTGRFLPRLGRLPAPDPTPTACSPDEAAP